MLYIYQLIIKIHINIVTIRLQRLQLRISKNPMQCITTSGTFLVTVDCYFSFLVYQTSNVFLPISIVDFYPALGFITIYHRIFLKAHILQYVDQLGHITPPLASQLLKVIRHTRICSSIIRKTSR